MSNPTLVFGMGATKAGTSWLHIYLSRHPECHFRAVKELHYFDTFNRPQWRERVPLERLMALAEKRENVRSDRKLQIDAQMADFTDWQEMLFQPNDDQTDYLAYLEKGSQDKKVVGDMTPAYSLLSLDEIKAIVALPRLTKFIYVMRSPIDRLWSNVRMAASRAGATANDFAAKCADILGQVLNGQHGDIIERSGYSDAVTKIDTAVAPSNRLYEFFENLFSDKAVRRITDFLGLSPFDWRFDKVIHGGVKQEMTQAQRVSALTWLRPQYEFVMHRFAAQVPASWHAELNEV